MDDWVNERRVYERMSREVGGRWAGISTSKRSNLMWLGGSAGEGSCWMDEYKALQMKGEGTVSSKCNSNWVSG